MLTSEAVPDRLIGATPTVIVGVARLASGDVNESVETLAHTSVLGPLG